MIAADIKNILINKFSNTEITPNSGVEILKTLRALMPEDKNADQLSFIAGYRQRNSLIITYRGKRACYISFTTKKVLEKSVFDKNVAIYFFTDKFRVSLPTSNVQSFEAQLEKIEADLDVEQKQKENDFNKSIEIGKKFIKENNITDYFEFVKLINMFNANSMTIWDMSLEK